MEKEILDKKQLAIAYLTPDGQGFFSLPWILSDFDTLESCVQKETEMKLQGYKNIRIFEIASYEEEYSWDYVYAHQIVKEKFFNGKSQKKNATSAAVVVDSGN